MGYNHNAYHISTDNSVTTWQDIIGDVKKNKVMAEILRDVLKKVDKEEGKCLIEVEELVRIRKLYNYDDTYIRAQLKNVQELLDSLDVAGLRRQLYSLELAIYDANEAIRLQAEEIERLKNMVKTLPTKEDIPTKVSELQNDANYVTEDAIPTKVSQLQNDAQYTNKQEVETAVEVKVEQLDLFVYEEIE